MNGRAVKFFVMLILLSGLFAGCAARPAGATESAPSFSVTSLSDDMTMEQVKAFLLAADSAIDSMAGSNKPTEKVIANHESSNIFECTGDYSSFDTVMKAADQYFASPDIVEKQLYMMKQFNVNGRIGMATSGKEDSYMVSSDSDVSVITDDGIKKELHVDAYNNAGESTPLTYTLEKTDGVWRISDIQGYGWPVDIDDVLIELAQGAWTQH